jgi:hypothetical protein
MLLALASDSQLVAFTAGDERCSALAEIKVADTATWACPSISGNRVFAKDREMLTLWTFE